MAIRPRSRAGSPSRSSSGSTLPSTRLTKKLATERDRPERQPRLEPPLEPGEERLDHLAVALDREEQRDVDADPGGDAVGDRREPLGACRES